MSFENRRTALLDLLGELTASEHQYVLVGGYAVSAFNTRFSTDLDLVVTPEDRDGFVEFLEDNGFEQTDTHRKQWTYDTEVLEYEKRLSPRQPIGVDLLVNGLGCRQTAAQWSAQYLLDHSHERAVSGGPTETTARVVDGSVLAAAKLHSSRETDIRDVVAIAEDVPVDHIERHLHRGDDERLREQLATGLEILDGDELRHGFRSDFGESAVSEDTVAEIRAFLRRQVETLSA